MQGMRRAMFLKNSFLHLSSAAAQQQQAGRQEAKCSNRAILCIFESLLCTRLASVYPKVAFL